MTEEDAVLAYRRAIGRRLRELRQQHAENQDDFADRIDVHRSYVGFLEGAKVDPKIGTLKKIALRLGMSLHEFLPPEEG